VENLLKFLKGMAAATLAGIATEVTDLLSQHHGRGLHELDIHHAGDVAVIGALIGLTGYLMRSPLYNIEKEQAKDGSEKQITE